MKQRFHFSTASALAAGALLAPQLGAQTPEVIYTEIATSATSVVPGAVDAGGSPVVTTFKALEDLTVSDDGSLWMVKGRNLLGSNDENTLILGSGTSGTAFAQEGQPFAGLPAGALYDFFDTGSPVSFNAAGDFAFSARPKGGSTLETVVFYDSTLMTHTILIRQGDLLSGTADFPPAPSGDETLGNSVGSVTLLDTGLVSYGVTPIGSCHSSRYPGFFTNTNVAFRQSGVSPITTFNGPDVYDDIDYDESGMTPDEQRWYFKAIVENEPTGSDRVLIIGDPVGGDVVVMQESFPINGTGPIFTEVFETKMLPSGDWIARGDDPSDNDWIVYNGTLVLQTGDPIGTESAGAVFQAVACNHIGDWAAIVRTDGPDATNEVLLLNGEVVLREGDPIDVDGNGMFDDGAFLGDGTPTSSAFEPFDLFLTDDLIAYFIGNLNDGLGNDLGSVPAFAGPNAFMRMQLTRRTFCDDSDGALASCPCGAGTPDSGCDIPQSTGGVSVSLVKQETSPQNRATLAGSGFSLVGNPGAVVIRAASLDVSSPVVFGDGLRCVAVPLVRLGATLASGGASTHTFGHGALAGSGDFYYQIWFRSTPQSYCDPTEAFNLSNGRVLTW